MEMYQEYRAALIELLNSINQEVGMSEENKVLILHLLNTQKKISAFTNWVKENMRDGTLQATEPEICRAAVQAAK